MGCSRQDQGAIEEAMGSGCNRDQSRNKFRELSKKCISPSLGKPIFQLNTEEYALNKTEMSSLSER